MAERKKQSLLTGAGVLAIATVLVKLIGALYKIPLTNLITVEGYAYFQGAYAVYNPLYAISMAGLPVAVSKLVSQNVEMGRIQDAKRIFTVARRLFLMVGLFGTVLLAAIAVPYSKMVHSPQNYISILTVAPCIVFCCQMSSFRGYYEGLKNMTPTGVSQVIEAVIKLVFGLAGTYVCFNHWLDSYHKNAVNGAATVFGVQVTNEAEALSAMYPYAAAVAILGVTLGSMFGLLYLFIRYKRRGFGFTREELVNSPPAESDKSIRKQLIRIAAPVALSSVILNVSNIIDDTTIRMRLAHAMEVGADVIKNMYSASLTASGTLEEKIVDYLYGTHGTVLNLKNLIPTITLTLGISAIPALSTAWAKRNKREIRVTIESVLRVTMMIALPAGIGMAALAEPIVSLLYSSQPDIFPIASSLLRTYGFGVFLFASTSPITNMLQAVGRTDIPLKTIAIGSAVKILMNFILIGNSSININGAPVSTTICYALMLAINLTSLLKVTKTKINFVSIFVKPLIAAASCGITAAFAYWLLGTKLALDGKISTLLAICAGGAVYAIILVFIKGISKDDLEMIPKGEKIAKVLAKFGLLG
ncbi:MAG: polysaccharide biosynthesis protein [Ruminococcus sp.]|nr:polysaccharide biosynthesis protein [Ruminococcus sp.]MCM1391409.1 polysaccharide biosynthesis protein [Ruminococcus sp.]